MDTAIYQVLLQIREILLNIESTMNYAKPVDAGLSAIKLSVSTSTPATKIVYANPDRKVVIIRNVGNSDIYIGSESVSTSTGMLLQPGETLVNDKMNGDVFAVAQTSDSTVSILAV